MLRRNLRVPVLLLWMLLLTMLGVACLTFYVLKGQRAEIEQTRELARQHLSSLLGARIDHALQEAIKAPLFLLRQAHGSSLTDERIAHFQSSYPYIDEVLVLDSQMRPIVSRPSLMSEYQQRLTGWVTERLQAERTMANSRMSVHTFVEAVDGSPTVFAFLSLHGVDDIADATNPVDDGWVLVQADFGRLRKEIVDPIVRQFALQHAVNVRLLDPSSAVDTKEIGFPVSALVPGWTLIVSTTSHTENGAVPMTRRAIIAASGGLLLAVLLICIAIAWDLRREYALVDLRNRFVANVSHELRTPLSLIRLYAETLHMKRIADPERQRQYCGMILAETERLTAMIDDVLDFSRLRRGLPTYSMEATQIGVTVEEVIHQYLPEWLHRGAQIRPSIDGKLPAVAHDPGAIKQILLNLINNAIEHGGVEKSISVSVIDSGDSVNLTVADTGVGIDESAQRSIQRSIRKGRVVEQAAGSGLGLALVEQISKAHRARFRLSRRKGQSGLEATVTFPLLQPGK
jgi:signal transduction histidine kinase